MKDYEEKFKAIIDAQEIADPAHDINHVRRVVRTARRFAVAENACREVVIPAAWLHDCVAVSKDSPDRSRASRMAAEHAVSLLTDLGYPDKYHNDIAHAIEAHSFSAGIEPRTLEARIVQDADRIDAIGAIGIARCMIVAGVMKSRLYAEDDPFCTEREPDDKSHAVDHFYAKLFKLEDSFHTRAAREEAGRRTRFMRDYLKQLEAEI